MSTGRWVDTYGRLKGQREGALEWLRTYSQLQARYMRPLWKRLLLLALLLLGGTGLNLLAPQFIRSFLDAAEAKGELRSLFTAASMFLSVALVTRVLLAITWYVSEDVAWRATNGLRSDLLLHILRLDMSFHNARTPGELIERVDGDVGALANFFSAFLIQIVAGFLLAVGMTIVLLFEDYRVGLSIAVFCVVYLIIHMRGQKAVVPFYRRGFQAKAELDGFLGERLGGVKEIKTSAATDYVMHRFYGVQRNETLTHLKGQFLYRGAWAMTGAMFRLGTAGVMGLGLYLFHADIVTIGTVFLILSYLQLLREPLDMVSYQFAYFQRARVGVERVKELLDTEPKVRDGIGAEIPPGEISVEFGDVTFGYLPDHGVLHDISFRLPPGRVLGLLGRTGSGKTTISRLLFRLYDVVSGCVRVGEVDVRDTRLAELRKRIGLVTQDVQLVQATLRDNLTLFDSSIPDERIMQVLEELGLDSWYRSLPEGLDTELAAGGGQLSAGEAQLLAFARVFLRDPDIVVLDEASSRLDPATEALIERAVERMLESRTAIVIAHRLSTVRRVDEIMVIEDGRVQEYGDREALSSDPNSRFSQLLRAGEVLR